MRRFATIAAVCIAVATAAPASGLASLWIGYVTQSASGWVTINLLGLNGLPWSARFRPIHEAEALDIVRRDLVRQKRIRDLPVLLVGPSHEEQASRISIEPNCKVSYGDASPLEAPLGECYLIELRSEHTFDDQLALMTLLPRLSSGIGKIEIGDLQALRSAQSAALTTYRDIVLEFDPIWSPDGTLLLYAVWRSGTIRFELREPSSGAVTPLQRLDEDMATRPIWSGDSRFVAYAALGSVKVYDTKTKTSRTIQSTEPGGGMETLIQFEGPELRLAFDGGFWSNYEVYAYNGNRRELKRLPPGTPEPGGEDAQNLDRHAFIRPVRSPDGKWGAFFTFAAVQRRIKVTRLR